ncbi:MAG: GntR family transcriptional regulator [Pseudomonadota bacterium]
MTQESEPATDWREVYRSLRDQIEAQELRAGDRLPTIADLAARAGISRHGARRVLERLRDEGRTQSWQGSGYRVVEPRVAVHLDSFPRWGLSTSRTGLLGHARLIGSRVVPANRKLAEDMGLKRGARVYLAELVRSAGDRPVALSRSHFPVARFAGILDDLGQTGSVTRALARHGVAECHRSRTRLECRMPTPHEALVIGIPKGQPVMVSTGLNTDPDGTVIEVSISTFRADCVKFEF